MTVIVGWVIIGAAVAIALTSFLSARGSGGSTIVNIIAGAVGGFIGGYVGMLVGAFAVGPGPAFLVSLLGAAVFAFGGVFAASKIVK